MSSQNKKHDNLTIIFLVVTSVFGLFMSIFFVAYPLIPKDDFAFRNLTVGSSFCAICILGIFAALFPGSCSTIQDFERRNRDDQSSPIVHEKNLRAHHPSCENFSTHVLRVGKREFCATCAGLLVGASAAIIGTIIYFFGGFRVGEPYTLASVGGFAVILGLLQSALPKLSSGPARFFASAVFVVGCLLMLVSLDEAVKNIAIDLFFIAVSLLLIMTKVAFSQRDHRQTCSQCTAESCR